MKYYCCACKRFSRTKLKCSKCSSEDVFDTTRPEWECTRCHEHTALFQDVCEACKEEGRDIVRVQVVTALMGALGVDVTDPDDPVVNPMEDFGDVAHRIFRGQFGPLHGDAR